MIRIGWSAVLLLAAWATSANAQETAVTRRAAELRDAPADTARSLASLPAQTPVVRGNERHGPWLQVRTASGATGWIHMFDLGPAANEGAASSGGDALGGALRGVTGLFGQGKPVHASTTAGIRGLGAEDLAQARPNPGAVTQMERLRQSEADARAFAAAAGVQPAVLPVDVESRPANPGTPQ
jgi:hypothetical protein